MTEIAPRKVAVIGGAGVMGHGIAIACLRKGHEVTIISRRAESVARGLALVADGDYGLRGAVRRGKLAEHEVEAMLDRVHGTCDLQAGVADADVVFESVDEDVALKQAVLSAAEGAAPADALLASGTSAIMIAELAGAMRDPSRLAGTHWFYPANVMALVEVARSELVSDRVHGGMLEFLVSLGKRPVTVRDSPGFFLTRFVNTWVAEAIRLIEEGIVGPAEVDEMVKAGLGWPMGIFELMDGSGGFDAWYGAQEYLRAKCGDRYDIPPLAERVRAAGYRGDPAVKPASRGGWHAFYADLMSNTDGDR
jgi:3-hydroxybutyryl-CoA dehydrogenase